MSILISIKTIIYALFIFLEAKMEYLEPTRMVRDYPLYETFLVFS